MVNNGEKKPLGAISSSLTKWLVFQRCWTPEKSGDATLSSALRVDVRLQADVSLF